MSEAASSPLPAPSPRLLTGLAVAAVVVATALRATFTEDMEFKGDESWMFDRSQAVGRGEPWPELGMPSGAGLRNPGLSIWLFVGLARLLGATTPLQLQHGVVAMAALAFLLLAVAIPRLVSEGEREPWLWGLLLAACNPLTLLLHRKIWAQSALPLFCALFLVGWLTRRRMVGAVVWGLVGALLGQIHMSGFFFAFGIALATAWHDVAASKEARSHWVGWVAGSVAGAAALLPWLRYVASGQDHGPPWSLETVASLHWFRWMASDVLGTGLDYSLGGNFIDFLRYPVLGDHHMRVNTGLFPALYAHGLLLGLGLLAAVPAVRHLVAQRGRLGEGVAALRRESGLPLLLMGGLLVAGVVLTLAGIEVHRHYLLVTFPLEFVGLALLVLRFAPRPRTVLAGLCVLQLGLSATFLHYIHVNGGAPYGDYGRAYRGP